MAEAGASSFQQAAEIYRTATNAGDADKIAALYAPNAVLLVPGLPPIVGTDAIRDLFKRNFALGKNHIEFLLARADSGTDRAGVYWEWDSNITPANGPVRAMKGRSFLYFRKQGDRWLIAFDTMQVRR
ncbi:MAG: YybH family protein [Beijerinckiaceae bacterium]